MSRYVSNIHSDMAASYFENIQDVAPQRFAGLVKVGEIDPFIREILWQQAVLQFNRSVEILLQLLVLLPSIQTDHLLPGV